MHKPWKSSCEFHCSEKSPGFLGAFGITSVVFVSLNSSVLPFHLGATRGPTMGVSHGLFQTLKEAHVLTTFTGAASLQLPPHPTCCSLSNAVVKAGTMHDHMLAETHRSGTLRRVMYSS